MTAETPSQEQPLVAHLLELRDRVLRMVLAVLAVFLLLFPFANDLYLLVSEPLRQALPAGSSMISTKPIDPFLIPFKLTLQLAIFIAVPYILYQFWAFVAPGLYKHEKKLVMPLLISSTALFYIGMAFAYFVVFPLVFAFLTSTAPEGIRISTDIGSYLDFVMTLFFAFGVAFEVPIATIILVWMGLTNPESLAQKRPYVIVGTFVVGMFLTPPDVISQTLLALPMWLLFELGLFFSRYFVRDESQQDEVQPAGAAAAASGGGTGSGVGETMEPAGAHRPDRFVPLSDAEMEAELDAIEAEEAELPSIEERLRRVQGLRDAGEVERARDLLYEILEEGDADQRRVARNILAQLDS